MNSPDDPFVPPAGEAPPGGGPAFGTSPSPGVVPYGTAPGGGFPPPFGTPPLYGQRVGGWQGPPLASWGARVGAAVIDVLLLFGIAVVGGIVAAALHPVSSALGGLVLVLTYVGVLAFTVWQLVVQGRTGSTIGKRRMGIRVLREADGQVLGTATSIGRYLMHVVDQLPLYLGYLWPLWDAKRQTFSDKIFKTVVIKA